MKYKGNKIVKKIIESGFTCNGIYGSECNSCPFKNKCYETPEEALKKVIKFIVDEIFHNSFDIHEGWVESEAMAILCYYTSAPELCKNIDELYEEKYGKKFDFYKNAKSSDRPWTPSKPKQFYVFNQQGGIPTRIHESYELALEEAKRISKKYYNKSIVVCLIKAKIKQEINTIVEEL